MTPPRTITCAICRRAVYETDVDDEGRCVLCQPPVRVKEKED